MYKGRRRRSQGTWLPLIGTTPENGDKLAFNRLALTIPTNGSGTGILGIVPLTYDAPQENDNDPNFDTLSEIVGNEYFLKRIVGTCLIGVHETVPSDYDQAAFPPYYMVTAGFFVARAEDSSSPNDGYPIGGINSPDYGPQNLATTREPWIWRRTWMLGSRAWQLYEDKQTGALDMYGAYPTTTAGYGSVADGPKVDAKTKRRVRQDDRLFFAVEARSSQSFTQAAALNVELDVRLFAQLRKAKNAGNF